MRITEQARQENRSRILARSEELFVTKGFEDCTTRDIAQAVGLATGTLFNYFPSKETLAMTMVSEALDRGRDDFEQRRRGTETLSEELFLFIASGLRQLRPLRPFLGPVLERSLSPFPRRNICPQGEATRLAHMDSVREIMSRHGFTKAPDYVASTMYWSLYLGILAFWTNDYSPNQEASKSLVDYAAHMFVQVISGTAQEAADESQA
jgi:AcrR family transcriptional regulator